MAICSKCNYEIDGQGNCFCLFPEKFKEKKPVAIESPSATANRIKEKKQRSKLVFINRSHIRNLIKSLNKKKQIDYGFYEALDRKVALLINKATKRSNGNHRLIAEDIQ